MLAYVVGRAFQAVLVVLVISIIVFLSLQLSGDPVTMMIGEGNVSPEDVARIEQRLGLDQPLYIQYLNFISRAVRGDFGESWRYNTATLPLVLERLPATLELTFAAMFFAIVIAFPLGVISAIKRDSFIDTIARILALAGVSFPNFWLGMILILLVSVQLGILPVSGRGGITYLILPALTLGANQAAILTRLLRSSMLEVLNTEYIKTARAKGLRDLPIYIRHALKNALIPVVTVLGMQFGQLLGGAIIVEVVFSWPGMGQLLVQSIGYRDFSVVQTGIMLLAVVFVIINLIVDVSYMFLDPRIRLA